MKYVDKLEKLIKKAASKYAGFPIALSGGIDSGLLAALIKPKFAINVELPGGEKYNESHYARVVARHLGITLHVVKLEPREFEVKVKKAIKIIGKPVPHFNHFPLYEMYQVLRDIFKVEDLVLADGPDESMCGYTRHLIMNYLYKIFDFEAFSRYHSLINKILFSPWRVYAGIVGKEDKDVEVVLAERDEYDPWYLTELMCKVDMKLKRPEVAMMSNKLAKHFNIKIHRPYLEKAVDEFMFNLPPKMKIHKVEYGKYALRLIAEKYLPKEIAWRKHKVGGPVYPVNLEMGWDKTEGEFGKKKWLEFQREVLNA